MVLGAPRQLALLPALSASHATWPSPLMPALPGLLAEHAGRALVVLASGDPTFYGIGSAVLAHDPSATVHPAPSSLALACARLGWAAQDVEVLSTVGRPPEAVRAALAPRRRLLVLVPDGDAPKTLAESLTSWGYGAATMTVLGSLGAAGGEPGRRPRRGLGPPARRPAGRRGRDLPGPPRGPAARARAGPARRRLLPRRSAHEGRGPGPVRRRAASGARRAALGRRRRGGQRRHRVDAPPPGVPGS